MPDASVLIFAKYPEPGQVKTRMIDPLSPGQAADLHRACLLAVIENVAACHGLSATLVVTPDARVADFDGFLQGVLLQDGCPQDRAGLCWPQGGGDLGRRLVRATGRAFAHGATNVLLLGADSPTIPASRLEESIARLADHDAVLGPCEDGGYYLLAMRRPMPGLFEGIAWGGPDVASQTRARAGEQGVQLHELPVWYDLDRFEDLARAARDLARMADREGPAAAALRTLIDGYLEQSP